MFAGSCIGVILLVMSLEALRRGATEYEAYIAREANKSYLALQSSDQGSEHSDNVKTGATTSSNSRPIATGQSERYVTPIFIQALIRATFHMLQFAIAYFVMLLAMYYNGYIIICIIIGAFLGYFVFSGFKAIRIGASTYEYINSSMYRD